MSDREYVKSLIDAVPEERLGEVVDLIMNISGDENEELKFRIVSEYILEKYRRAFEELAK